MSKSKMAIAVLNDEPAPKGLNVNGVAVELRSKASLVKIIKEMNEDASNKLKAGKVKTNAKRNQETGSLSFFASIVHYLEGGAE